MSVREVWKRYPGAPAMSFNQPPRGGQADDGRWALRDISLDVRAGEALAVVGRNGSGKSTLLKLVSRVTRPSRGSIATRGRIAPLLELGVGMHPELTGRENALLYASLVGMRRSEAKAQLEAILHFAELDSFADTRLKQFSSGMHLRLAFAVIAHLEPSILLLDEVFAVGDLAFQVKCARRIREMRESGAAILFVSHNLSLATSLCERAVWLDEGVCQAMGDAVTVVSRYAHSTASAVGQTQRGSGHLVITDDQGGEADILAPDRELHVNFHGELGPLQGEFLCSLLLRRVDGLVCAGSARRVNFEGGPTRFEMVVRNLRLVSGWYQVELYLSDPAHTVDHAIFQTRLFECRGVLDERFGAIALDVGYVWKEGVRDAESAIK